MRHDMRNSIMFGCILLAAVTIFPMRASAEETEMTTVTETTSAVTETITTVTETTQTAPPPVAPLLTGWQEIGNRFYYYDTEGMPVTGITEIDGFSYLFAPNGALQTGWQTIDEKRFYVSPETGKPVFGQLAWRGQTYYIDSQNGKAASEIVKTENGSFYVNSFGYTEHSKMITLNDAQTIYVDADGFLVSGLVKVKDDLYYFDENGIQQTGWQNADGKLYYFDPSDAYATFGWITLNEQDEIQTYYVDEANGRYSGFQAIDEKQYYFDENGILQTGLKAIDGDRYYFDNDGVMLTGIHLVPGGAIYAFDSSGKMLYGFQEIDGKQYYFAENGTMQKGLQTINGYRYYFDNDGVMLTGIHLVPGGAIYAFDSSGKMLYGFQQIDGKQYYFAENGTMQKGLVIIDNLPYAFDQNGVLGNGWTIRGTNYYYCDTEGHPLSGWQEIDGQFYFFDEQSYIRLTSTQIDDFILDEQGVAKSTLYTKVESLLTQSGTTPDEIYSYVTSHYRYRKIEATRTRQALTDAGWDKLVSYTITNKKGVCYYLAATMDYFLQLAGYQTRLVHATHSTGDHYWNQVLVNGVWLNYDPTYKNRGNISWNRIISLGSYSVYGYVTVQYDARGAYVGAEFTSYS